jgi:hypothetical protein
MSSVECGDDKFIARFGFTIVSLFEAAAASADCGNIESETMEILLAGLAPVFAFQFMALFAVSPKSRGGF